MNLNPDGPHSPERTGEAGQLFDDCSRFLVYATMSEKHGLAYPANAYRLIADFYAATSRLPQACEQIGQFLEAQGRRDDAYDARGRDPRQQAGHAAGQLARASAALHAATAALQAAQTAIAGLGIYEDEGGEGDHG